MKRNTKLQRWILSSVAGLALAGSISLSQGAVALTNDLNADATGWGVGFGTGSVEWNATAGPDGSGCLMFVLDASAPANNEIGPRITFANATGVGTTINSAEYASIEYDLRIDPGSGFDAGGSSYGNYQEALSDASWSWDSHWVGALGSDYNSYTHMKFAIPNVAKVFPYLTFALQGTAPYSGSVTGYIDNLVINPFINPLVAGTFATADDVLDWSGGGRASVSYGAIGNPPGSLQVDVAYDDSTPGGWQEGLATYPLSFSPNRYTYADFDLYIENPNPGELEGPGLGQATLFLNTGGWSTVGTVPINTNMLGKWTHVQRPMPGDASASQLIFQFGGNALNFTNALRYYLDNIQFFKPNVPPTVAISQAGPSGVQITLSQTGNQWQREAIVTPASAGDVMWSSAGSDPVTYSFTIAEFPDKVTHEGFEAHLYIVNGDTASTGDQTYGGCDWNVPDIAIMSIWSITNNGGSYACQFQWKTNQPNANPLEDVAHRPGAITNNTILGTWSLTFKDKTNVTMSGPGGISTNFFMSEEAVTGSFSPSTSFLQFGFHKNDNENNGHNDGTSGTYSQVGRATAAVGSFTFNDTFGGPTLTNNYDWRKTLASAINEVPPGTAWFIDWTLPADGFVPQSSGAVDGTWGDAGVVNIYQVGTKMYGQIPAAALPAGNAAFFRMFKAGP